MPLDDLIAPLLTRASSAAPPDLPAKRSRGRPRLDAPPRESRSIALTAGEWAAIEAMDPEGKGNSTRALRHWAATLRAQQGAKIL